MPEVPTARLERGAEQIYRAPPGSGEVVLGRTLVSLLDEAVTRYPNAGAFNQKVAGGWQPVSNEAFRTRAERLALGLQTLGLAAGDRVGLYLESDLSFCLADMACLLAGLVDVPLYLTHPGSAIVHILNETESRLLVCGRADLLANMAGLLGQTQVETVVLYDDAGSERADLPGLPRDLRVLSFAELEARGEPRHEPGELQRLRERIGAQDLATILYTSGTTGLPKGVMLTHENISFNAIAAMTGLHDFEPGASGEVAISFLPLTHIFARTLHYCLMWYGTSVYFSDPEALREDLRAVRPTFFAAVPRVLEKAYDRILAAGESLTGAKRRLFDWALALAQRYDVEAPPKGVAALEYALADKLVYAKWREALGGNIRQIIVGGAALRPELVNILGAAGISVLQGYGLTETSPVVAYNRPDRNRPGTVGPLLAGVEVKLSGDGEILTRGPHVMKGYYRQPEKTAEVLLEDGWFRTGDLGEVTEDGYLKITGRAKNLFKLSTGKYVMPQPLEERLEADRLIDTALVVGEGEKFCGALLFLNRQAVLDLVGTAEASDEALLGAPALRARLLELVHAANAELPAWSQVKRAALSLAELSMANGLLTPTLKLKRGKVKEAFQPLIEALYREDAERSLPILELTG